MARHPDDRPAWAERIRSERVIRGWSQAEAVRALRVHFAGDPAGEAAGDASLLHDWKRWEAGLDEPDRAYKPVLARTFGTVTAALFPPSDPSDPSDPDEPDAPAPASGLGTVELLDRMRSPDLDARTLPALEVRVEGLCSRYARAPAQQLLPLTRTWQRRVAGLLDRRLTLDQHRELLRLAGFLTLLVGCLEWDLGLMTDAETSRRLALSLGHEGGSADVRGWAFELQAWFALSQGDYRTVIAAVEGGRAVAAGRPVAAQLSAQAAQAWARIGERRQVEVALDQARHELETLPPAPNPANHFAVDPFRFDLWAMDCYRVLGEDRLAAGYAREVLRQGEEGRRSPMRAAAAELTLGVVAARAGSLDVAVHHGKLALGGERASLPSLLMIARELLRVLDRDFAGRPGVCDYAYEVRLLELQLLG